jgi:hypothetical protein
MNAAATEEDKTRATEAIESLIMHTKTLIKIALRVTTASYLQAPT